MQVAEAVAEVLLQAQTDVLVEVAADPDAPSHNVDSAVVQAYFFISLLHYNSACNLPLPLLLAQACCNRKRSEFGSQRLHRDSVDKQQPVVCFAPVCSWLPCDRQKIACMSHGGVHWI